MAWNVTPHDFSSCQLGFWPSSDTTQQTLLFQSVVDLVPGCYSWPLNSYKVFKFYIIQVEFEIEVRQKILSKHRVKTTTKTHLKPFFHVSVHARFHDTCSYWAFLLRYLTHESKILDKLFPLCDVVLSWRIASAWQNVCVEAPVRTYSGRLWVKKLFCFIDRKRCCLAPTGFLLCSCKNWMRFYAQNAYKPRYWAKSIWEPACVS